MSRNSSNPKSRVHPHPKIDFEAINAQNDHVLDELKTEWDQYNMVVSELKTKKNKDTKFIEGGAGYFISYRDI